ncbi:hypothetical protein F5Y10DRAFT_246502 [Nemania abortiva]|nr:hypothetical protein F5Y10DRAFT_246502 [Nemania abortiva]
MRLLKMSPTTLCSSTVNTSTLVSFSHGDFISPELEPFWPEFEAKIPDLFSSSDHSKVGFVEHFNTCLDGSQSGTPPAGNSEIGMRWISSLEELNSILSEKSTISISRLFVLQRFNSWSRIDISLAMFQTLFTINSITPQFLKIMMGLGRKSSSIDEDFMSCYSQFAEPVQGEDVYSSERQHSTGVSNRGLSDLCYNIRHFERHGRDLDDPWSCRQSAIHQKYNMDTNHSDWIIVHPPLRFIPRMTDYNKTHPMQLHLNYLAAGIGGWREYLNYLSSQLKLLNGEIAISKPYADFGIGFSSKQQVHNLRQKLHHAGSILANTANILTTIKSHEEATAKLCKITPSTHQYFQRELRNMSGELKNYKQTVQELLSVADDISQMYDDILKYHGQELLHNNGLKLTHIAQMDSYETKTMAFLASRTHQDSRTMRIATVIAMFYLPANLVASFFSTTLVWFENSGGQGTGQSFALRVHRETWIAVLATLFLVACTTFTSWWWERKEKKLLGLHPSGSHNRKPVV